MKRIFQGLLWLVAILLLSFPLTLIITFLLSPLWSWVEANWGIESMGHSGPADWCFLTVYVLLVLGFATIVWLLWRHSRRGKRTQKMD